MKRNKWITTVLATAIMLVAIPTNAKGADESLTPSTADRSQIVSSPEVEFTIEDTKASQYPDVAISQVVDLEDVISVTNEEKPQTRAGISNKYGWDRTTYAYGFSQTWSTNNEVYSTYPWYDDGLFYPAATATLNNPKSMADYNTAARQGYLNDSWTGMMGGHVYYHPVTSTNLNTVTLLLDYNVEFYVYDMNLNMVLNNGKTGTSSVLSYYSGYSSPKYLHTFKLATGDYFIMFIPSEGARSSVHYAMFTGQPLPIANTYRTAGLHDGSVKWNGFPGSQTYDCTPFTISVSSGSNLYALQTVTFQDMTPQVNNIYISSAQMMYKSPNSTAYKTLGNAGSSKTFVDGTPDSGSIIGTYNTRVTVNWVSGLSYVYANYFTNSIMTLNYLTPYGEAN